MTTIAVPIANAASITCVPESSTCQKHRQKYIGDETRKQKMNVGGRYDTQTGDDMTLNSINAEVDDCGARMRNGSGGSLMSSELHDCGDTCHNWWNNHNQYKNIICCRNNCNLQVWSFTS